MQSWLGGYATEQAILRIQCSYLCKSWLGKLISTIYSKVELGKIISSPIANLKLEHMGTVDAKFCVVLGYGYFCQGLVYRQD